MIKRIEHNDASSLKEAEEAGPRTAGTVELKEVEEAGLSAAGSAGLQARALAAPAEAKRLRKLAGALKGTLAARSLLRQALLALLLGSVTLGGIAPAGLAPGAAPAALAAAASTAGKDTEQPQSWLLKWRSPALEHELRGTQVLRRQNEAAVMLIRPADKDADVQEWLRRLQSLPGVEYVHPNGLVHMLSLPADEADAGSPSPEAEQPADAAADSAARVAAAAASTAASTAASLTANDPELPKQLYLGQIGAKKAWETVREQRELTIAIVDTGVDLNHPDLVDNLVPGANLVEPGKPPEDDNGHGTSVAGVIAAQGNNGIGVSGILWRAKIMPIKALDHRGDGTEQELGEAILYAVRAGAKIVVLSVGLHRYSPYMLDIVQYAESKSVLLVAAAGNDGVAMGEKAAVKYPAAYPTVLAVGGVKTNNAVDARSNRGTELDLVAPWHVYTTAVGGSYKKEEGTSMAAPQAAAAAALIWARYKTLKPYQVRELLRQTAKDIGTAGADSSSGYGILQIDQAVSAALETDRFEPNESQKTAARFPLGTQISGLLSGTADHDWYRIDTPFDGKLTLQYEGLVASGKIVPPVRISQYTNGARQSTNDTKLANRSIEIDVKKGQHLIHLELINQNSSEKLPYLLTSTFTMKQDYYEQNDKSYEASTLQPRSQTITGNFHQLADRDWYAVTFSQSGKLSLSLSTNTARIDPGLALQKAGQQLMVYDDESEGETEKSPVITVTPGKYYIRVHNAISSEASPTLGTYTLRMDYTPKYDDPNEPNDKSYEAFMINPGTEYLGVISSSSDVDWFQFRVAASSMIGLAVSGVPMDIHLKLQLFDKRMKQIATASTGKLGKLQTKEQLLQPGVYYAKLQADAPFDKQYYQLKLQAQELIAGFKDIRGHWAQNEIVALNKQGIINGTGNNRFEPKRAITRAEAVAMVVKAYKPIPKGSVNTNRFTDVPANHWAYAAITSAVGQGWVKGFPGGSFKPDQPITRAEMALIIGYAEGVKPRLPIADPFIDVSRTHWSAPMLFAMKVNGQLEGVNSGGFKPKQQASRADFTVLLHRVMT
ncbi:subtilisin family serine protease [Paenibacillus endophyticus]|uniref:Subtilisin family serine protease n=1 Tax=Paenibacillus endophyticus TaxID=1294268 RepID=A0A7W5CC76_9BACL|nr:S8 family serine peptidase [Paenibacillus endophyticus]MBB3154590.1 subtilisin family serine protease [Paenibacillus endophyticus]